MSHMIPDVLSANVVPHLHKVFIDTLAPRNLLALDWPTDPYRIHLTKCRIVSGECKEVPGELFNERTIMLRVEFGAHSPFYVRLDPQGVTLPKVKAWLRQEITFWGQKQKFPTLPHR